jgi:hypothetical protein
VVEERENQSGAEAGRGHGVLRWVWITGLVLVAYVLGIGPACKLCEKGVISKKTLSFLYAPVDPFTKRFRVTGSWFLWYIEDVWKVPPGSF